MDLGYAGIIITAIAGTCGTIITALIRLPRPSANGTAKKLGGMSERLGADERDIATLKANYGDIMRRLDSQDKKLDELLKRE